MVVRSSTNNHRNVCILFDEITPRGSSTSCLIGIDEGYYLCNKITTGAAQTVSPNNFGLTGWWDSFAAESYSGSSSSGSSSTTQGAPIINPNI